MFDEIQQVVIDWIIENMASLVQLGMYGTINIDDTTSNGLYVIQFLSDAYTLQNNTAIDRQVISSGELVVKEQYLYLFHARKHQLIFETRTTATENYGPKLHITPSKSWC